MRFLGLKILFASGTIFGIGCSGMHPTTQVQPGIPEFVMRPLLEQKVQKAKFYTNPDGSFRKFAVYVEEKDLPAWVIQIADEKIGKGQPKSCEIEQYQDGSKVYEVTRVLEGRTIEIAVAEDRNVRYQEKQLSSDELPDEIQQAIRKQEGFRLQEAEVKETANTKTYEIEGSIGETFWSFEYDEKGKVKRRTMIIPSKLAIDQP